MKIVHVTNNYYPYCAGVVKAIDTLVQQQQQHGHDVHIITLDFLGEDHKDPKHVIRVPSLFRFQYQKNHMAVPWRAEYSLRELFTKIQPDIVHVHHPFLLGYSAVKVAQRLGIKTIFTYHTMYENYIHYVPLPNAAVRQLTETAVIAFCQSVDHIIAPSSSIKDYLQSHGIKHVSCIASAIDRAYIEQSLHLKQITKPMSLLYVGRFTKEKNILLLLDMMVLLPSHFQLQLVGFGSEYEALQEYAYTALQLTTDRVQFIHKPSNILEYYNNAHCFVFSSTTDTQGLVLAEAMACSLPIIAVDGPGQRDIIRNGCNGYIVHSAHAMAQKIQVLFHDQKQYSIVQRSAFETARSYDPRVHYTAMHQQYEALFF